jgi:lipoyl synthase
LSQGNRQPPEHFQKIPAWAKKNLVLKDLHMTKSGLRGNRLHSVCEEARCPNITECFSKPSATFLILGDVCTRSCGFCSIRKGTPAPTDEDEALLLARTASSMNLRHVVITSVTRDDLPDQGAAAFARAIRTVKEHLPEAGVEVLVPDFSGSGDLVRTVLREEPDVFNHNVETVERLYPAVRPQASLQTSLEVLGTAREWSPGAIVKSGFMLGLGEEEDEVVHLLELLCRAGCDVVTIGQYLRPSRAQLPVRKYWEPQDFQKFSDLAKSIGIRYVISGPLVRSSYQAGEVLDAIREGRRRTGLEAPERQQVTDGSS